MPDAGRRGGRAARLRELFAAAVELPPQRREAWLADRTAGDGDLLAELRSLLAADAQSSPILSSVNLGRESADESRDVPPPIPAEGIRLGHYRLDAWIGEGGMGHVFKARDLALDRPAAVKLIRPEVGRQQTARLLQEVQASARLQHPSIATFFEGGEEEGVAYLAMELVEGTTLRRTLDGGPLAPREALTILTHLLEALAHAHTAGLLHRDIKPENVIITPDGRLKLLDFGIARAWSGMATDAATLPGAEAAPGRAGTVTAGAAGTPGYMSPEQLRGEALTPASDVFQVGALAYEMLTGRRAFGEGSLVGKIAATLAGIPDLRPLEGLKPSGLARLLATALAPAPADRFESAPAFLRQVDAFANRMNALQHPDRTAAGAPSPAERGLRAGELQLSARQLWQSGSRDAHPRVFALLFEALELSPDFVPALSLLAAAHATSYIANRDPASLAAALAAADRALAFDPGSGEAWSWRAYALLRLQRVDEALDAYAHATRCGDDAMTSYLYGSTLSSIGRFESALPHLQHAVTLEPRHGIGWLSLGWTLHSLIREEEARVALERARSLEGQPGPTFVAGVGGYLAECLRGMGELELARIEALRGLESIERSDHSYRDTIRAFCLGALGRVALATADMEAARAALAQAVGQMRSRRLTLAGGHAFVQALAGLARANRDESALREAITTFDAREGYSFHVFFGCGDDTTAFELAVAAADLGLGTEASRLGALARAAGSRRPFLLDQR